MNSPVKPGLPQIPRQKFNFKWVEWKLPLKTKRLKATEPDGWEPHESPKRAKPFGLCFQATPEGLTTGAGYLGCCSILILDIVPNYWQGHYQPISSCTRLYQCLPLFLGGGAFFATTRSPLQVHRICLACRWVSRTGDATSGARPGPEKSEEEPPRLIKRVLHMAIGQKPNRTPAEHQPIQPLK